VAYFLLGHPVGLHVHFNAHESRTDTSWLTIWHTDFIDS